MGAGRFGNQERVGLIGRAASEVFRLGVPFPGHLVSPRGLGQPGSGKAQGGRTGSLPRGNEWQGNWGTGLPGRTSRGGD